MSEQYPPPGGQSPGYGQPPAYGQPPGPPPGQPPGYPAWGGGPGAPGGGPGGAGSKGGLAALFDFSFRTFAAPTLIKIAYVLATVGIGLFYLIIVIAGFSGDEPAVGAVVLVLGWIPALFYLVLIRMGLELYYAIFRMSDDVNKRLPTA